MIENETRRYGSDPKRIASKHNNIPLSRQEKAKAKKRERRYPSYGHIKGEYALITNSDRFHITKSGKSTNYYYSNLENRQYNYYKLHTHSVVRKNLQQSNYRIFQPARTSWKAREGPARENFYVLGSMPHGGNSREPQLPSTQTTERRMPQRTIATGASNSTEEGVEEEEDHVEEITEPLLLSTARYDHTREVGTSNFIPELF